MPGIGCIRGRGDPLNVKNSLGKERNPRSRGKNAIENRSNWTKMRGKK